MANIQIIDLTKQFGDFTAVKHMNLTAEDGEMLALLGGSGCGKTTTLRMIAGFSEPTSGQILVDGKDIGSIPPYKRNISIFFQNYALFPHMTVFENVAFGLKMQKCSKEEIRQRVSEMLALVKLSGFDGRYPRQLSGGQQQRVALARALVTRPSILLLDEPLSNLDAKLRVEMQVEIKRIQRALGITTIIVTHDHEEAVSLADRVIVMNAGEIQQIGTPEEVFNRPSSAFIADFMGFSTFITGTIGPEKDGYRPVACSGKLVMTLPEASKHISDGASVTLAIRSENMDVVSKPGMNTFAGTVSACTYRGNTTRIEVTGCFNETIIPAVDEYIECQGGEDILVYLPPERLCIYKN